VCVCVYKLQGGRSHPARAGSWSTSFYFSGMVGGKGGRGALIRQAPCLPFIQLGMKPPPPRGVVGNAPLEWLTQKVKFNLTQQFWPMFSAPPSQCRTHCHCTSLYRCHCRSGSRGNIHSSNGTEKRSSLQSPLRSVVGLA